MQRVNGGLCFGREREQKKTPRGKKYEKSEKKKGKKETWLRKEN